MHNNIEVTDIIRQSLQKNFPCGLVPRTDIGRNTGGILHPRTLANLDSLGVGIENPVKIGRKVFYPVDAVLAYIESKILTLSQGKL
jgi:hypothetical protein